MNLEWVRSSLDLKFFRNCLLALSAGTLFFVGTGTLKGFAITLAAGIVASMFTAIVLTHLMLKIVVDEKIIPNSDSPLVYK